MSGTPVLFLAGVPKAGTSSLFNWLAHHPQIQGSTDKETCFFADPESHVYRPEFNAETGIERFHHAFPAPTGETRLRVEGTPTHIYSRTALTHIPALPDAKCLFVVRDPATQIRSIYDYYRNTWDYIPEAMGFSEFVDTVRRGGHDFGGNELASRALDYADYNRWLDPWRAKLGQGRMMVCSFDRLRDDPMGLVHEIAEWCDLSPEFFRSHTFPVENESYVPKNRVLQRLNIALRGHLPKGRLYDWARRFYRRANTRAPDRADDSGVQADLRRHFATANARLATEYALDLSAWEF
ncbi:sulfotransferase family protein [Antarctobacter sp.]|uniref:sulfotransferase family protein n=1 Tax=Antarctobacter sp. TaxID=1872577 RepID=UPI003A92CAE5